MHGCNENEKMLLKFNLWFKCVPLLSFCVEHWKQREIRQSKNTSEDSIFSLFFHSKKRFITMSQNNDKMEQNNDKSTVAYCCTHRHSKCV